MTKKACTRPNEVGYRLLFIILLTVERETALSAEEVAGGQEKLRNAQPGLDDFIFWH
jgi:hypothetical protein